MGSYSVFFTNYTIGTGIYREVPGVCQDFGKKIFLIGGERALLAGKEKLVQALADSPLTIVQTELFGADCTYERMEELARLAEQSGAEMIFGMGGGKALDTAKGTAQKAGLPVFTFPTIASTCAATTALSVVYRQDGNFDSFYFYEKPARHCFIDLDIIAHAPWRYLRAGMGDTIGKHFECHLAARGDKLDHSSALGREISNMCYEPLREHGVQALADCRLAHASWELEQAVLANIVSTGLVSLMVLDDYNCAIAHSVYYGLVLLPGFEEKYLHGDVVAYGVLVQLAIDGQTEQLGQVRAFLQELGIPVTLREMEISLNREVLQPVLTETVNGPDMEHLPYPVSEDMVFEGMKLVEEYR
ncbi:MAG: iron-containing alcohol dehydrogenase family protein [Lachnospiraceae bacterium]|nr:iron-containing alcohol dehydrogenase family protein [Lachnospiraceae bacterium]